MMRGLIGSHLISMREKGRLAKPSLMVHATMDSTEKSPSAYDVEEAHRLTGEIQAIEDKLDNWDHEEAGKQAQKSLKNQLASKNTRLQEIRTRLDLSEGEELPKKKNKGNGMAMPKDSDSDY